MKRFMFHRTTFKCKILCPFQPIKPLRRNSTRRNPNSQNLSESFYYIYPGLNFDNIKKHSFQYKEQFSTGKKIQYRI